MTKKDYILLGTMTLLAPVMTISAFQGGGIGQVTAKTQVKLQAGVPQVVQERHQVTAQYQGEGSANVGGESKGNVVLPMDNTVHFVVTGKVKGEGSEQVGSNENSGSMHGKGSVNVELGEGKGGMKIEARGDVQGESEEGKRGMRFGVKADSEAEGNGKGVFNFGGEGKAEINGKGEGMFGFGAQFDGSAEGDGQIRAEIRQKVAEKVRAQIAAEDAKIVAMNTVTDEGGKVYYEVKAEKEAKFLGLFKTKLTVEARVDAETGAVVEVEKPWYAIFLF